MPKKPTLGTKRWAKAQGITVAALIVLMLAVSYLGTMDAKTASVTLPSERIRLDGATAEPSAAPASTAPPEGGKALEDVSETASTVQPASAQLPGTFESYRLSLAATRESAAKLLDEVIESSASSAETVAEAQRQKAELARAMEVETAIETLLEARGFEEVLCTVRNGSVNVVVRGAKLDQRQAAQILDIAVAESGEAAANVRIIPAE